MWSATRILWDQQVMLLWILLPPIFLVSALLVMAGPYLERRAQRRELHIPGNVKPDAAPLG